MAPICSGEEEKARRLRYPYQRKSFFSRRSARALKASSCRKKDMQGDHKVKKISSHDATKIQISLSAGAWSNTMADK